MWYEWRIRAKKVCIKPLASKRPSPNERKKWENKIIQVEKECGIYVEKKKVVKKHYEEKTIRIQLRST